MGFLDRLLGGGAPQPEPEPALEFTVTIGHETSHFSIPVDPDEYFFEDPADDGPQQNAAECWRPLGERIEVAGRQIDGGVYVGSGLRGADNTYIREPSLIDPGLKVGTSIGASGPEKFYWPSYEALDEGQRGGYLNWLASPRKATGTSDTYLFIYYYGLERRLLADPGYDHRAKSERRQLIVELERLASEANEESEHSGFATHSKQLLSFLEAQDLLRDARRVEPPSERAGWEVPPTLKLMIGELAAAGQPLPTELALSWIRTSPEACLRTPATRCPEEFASLFCTRYEENFGDGIALPPGQNLELSYSASSQGIQSVYEKTKVPDVTEADKLIEPLRDLGRNCCTELDPYSRWLGRNPEGRGSFKGVALLPAPLIAGVESPELDSLRSILERITTDEKPWFFDQGELIELWSPGAEKLPKKEAVMVNQLVESLGYAIEPDQRFGGPSPRPGAHAVLFESNDGDPRSPSPAYAVASLLLHLLSTVATADGTISTEEEELLDTHIHGVEELYPGERARLKAHATWLTRSKPKFNGMRKKLEQLGAEQREGLARSLVALAAADGEISPEEVKILGKIFDLLGLDPKSVYSELHSASSADPGEEPALGGDAGPSAGDGGTANPGGRKPRGLDRAAIDRKVEETALVSTMLAGIFEEPEENVAPEPAAPAEGAAVPSPERELLHRLCERESWSREELEALAAELELMLDGAIEQLNDAAFGSCGEPLAEGEDPVYIDAQVGKELMA